jgi:hypothetical protein
MIVTHELNFGCRCPVNEGVDIYKVTIETNRVVMVEDILAAVAELPEKAFQEDITIQLAATLRCHVTTIGIHSGVKTTCKSS